jgi:hypothetical protein
MYQNLLLVSLPAPLHLQASEWGTLVPSSAEAKELQKRNSLRLKPLALHVPKILQNLERSSLNP